MEDSPRPVDAPETSAAPTPLEWFRERLHRERGDKKGAPCADLLAAIFGVEAIGKAADLDPLEATYQAVREHIRSEGANLRDWEAAVRRERQRREYVAEETRRDYAPQEGDFFAGEDEGDWRGSLRCDPGKGPRASFGNLCMILEHALGPRLTYDEMAITPCLDGKPLEDRGASLIRRNLESREDIEFTAGDTRDAIALVSAARPFHPVRDYLRGIKWDRVKRIPAVAADLLGDKDPLSRKMVVRFFIAAVARAIDPGCKVDTALVLLGDEGLKKSTFYRVLGGDWFKDSTVDIGDRRGQMLMHSAWIYEWPEVDRMLEKKHDSEVKAYITQQDDSFVPMYGRTVSTFKRSCIVVGTTNRDKFITSETGSRRWWVITVRIKIDAAKLRAQRDQLWAEAVVLYDAFKREKANGIADDLNPYRWWLNDIEEGERARRNEDHVVASPDLESVGRWLAGDPMTCVECKGSGDGYGTDSSGNVRPCTVCKGSAYVQRADLPKDGHGRSYVTQCDVLLGPLGVPLERHEMNATRVSRVLRRLGWRPGKRIRPGGVRGPYVTPYYSPEPDPEADAAETGISEAAE